MRLGGELIRRGHDAAVFTHAPATPNPIEPELQVFGAPARAPIALADTMGFGTAVVTDSVSANDAIVFLAGANLGAAFYEYGLARLTLVFLRRPR